MGKPKQKRRTVVDNTNPTKENEEVQNPELTEERTEERTPSGSVREASLEDYRANPKEEKELLEEELEEKPEEAIEAKTPAERAATLITFKGDNDKRYIGYLDTVLLMRQNRDKIGDIIEVIRKNIDNVSTIPTIWAGNEHLKIIWNNIVSAITYNRMDTGSKINNKGFMNNIPRKYQTLGKLIAPHVVK